MTFEEKFPQAVPVDSYNKALSGYYLLPDGRFVSTRIDPLGRILTIRSYRNGNGYVTMGGTTFNVFDIYIALKKNLQPVIKV